MTERVDVNSNGVLGSTGISLEGNTLFLATAAATGVKTATAISNADVGFGESIALRPLNHAPVLDATRSPVLSSIVEDAGPPTGAVGTLVNTLVDLASPAGGLDNFLDNDGDAQLGIAITGADASNGVWWYSLDGSVWSVLPAVSDAAALLLSADVDNRVYFEPGFNFSGTTSSALTFRAWDRSSGTSGAVANATVAGGSSAFSIHHDSAALTVSAVNDAPGLGDGTLASVAVNTANPPGQTISAIFTDQFSDADAGASFAGIAVVGNGADAGTEGVWQYSADSGANWFAVGIVEDGTTALVTSAISLVRFVPFASFTGAPAPLVVRGLDDTYAGGFSTTGGTESRVTVNSVANGGATPIAAVSATLGTTVTAVTATPLDAPPVTFAFSTIRPNPSPGPITMQFSLPKPARVKLTILDAQGREIVQLADDAYAAGRYQVGWDGRSNGQRLAPGIYFARLLTPGHRVVRSFTIVR